MSQEDSVTGISVKRSTEDANNDTDKLAKLKKDSEDDQWNKLDLNTEEKCASPYSVDEAKPKSSYFDFNKLPPEIFDIIFSEFYMSHKLSYRLVCKSWHERITDSIRNITLSIGRRELLSIQRSELLSIERRRLSSIFSRSRYFKKYRSQTDVDPVERLEQCNFKTLDLTFYPYMDNNKMNMNNFPPSLWEKIGPKIRVLNFHNCQLGDLIIKEVLLNCCNLQVLRVHLKNGVLAESFCSLSTLERMENVAPKNLETFKISRSSRLQESTEKWDPEILWTGVLEAFFRLFSTLSVISCSCEHFVGSSSFYYEFVREMIKNEQLKLATALAGSLLSDSFNDGICAMNTLATQSLKRISFCFRNKDCFTREQAIVLLNFFDSQRKLECVSVGGFFSGRDSTVDEFDKEILRAIFFKIIQSCPDLRHLSIYPNTVYDLPWLRSIQDFTNIMKLETFWIDHFQIRQNALSISGTCFNNEKSQNLTSMYIIPKYAYITHLSIGGPISDQVFQCIFKHMTNLKTLSIFLSKYNADFAFTGRRNDVTENAPAGYSINRLQNLRRCEIIWTSDCARRDLSATIPFRDDIKLRDNVLREFRFPKLYYLSCFSPEELSLLAKFGIEMPSLETIRFFDSEKISSKALVYLCQSTKKLDTIIVGQSQFDLEGAKEIFQVCPSLRTIHSKVSTYYYEPFTKRVLKHRAKYCYS